MIVPIEYLQYGEGSATKCAYGHTFKILYRDWMVNNLDNRQPSQKSSNSSTTFLRCNLTATWIFIPVPLLPVLDEIPNFLPSFEIRTIAFRISSLSNERRPQSYNTPCAHSPTKSETHCSNMNSFFYLFQFFFSLYFYIHFLLSFNSIYLDHIYFPKE